MTRLRSRTVRLDPPVDPFDLAGGTGFVWSGPGGELVGTGTAARIPVGTGADRVERAAEAAAALLAGAEVDDPAGAEGGPVAVGALPFSPEAPGELVVPALLLRRDIAGATSVTATVPAPAAPPSASELLARLREAEFVDYDVPDGGGDVVRLPASGLRIVVVSGPDASVPLGDALMPVLTDLTSDDQPAPVVAVEPSRVPEDQIDGDDPPAERLVDVIRDDGDLSQYVSTVDDLDRVSGRVATVLALVDAQPGSPRIGHYGTEDGTELLPPVEDAESGS